MQQVNVFFIAVVLTWNFAGASVAHAKDYRMVQANKTFVGDVTDQEATTLRDNLTLAKTKKIEVLNVKLGDQIVFSNRDDATHNVLGSQGEASVFDVGEQPPGKENDRVIKIEKKGETTVQCRIHPKMKLKIIAE